MIDAALSSHFSSSPTPAPLFHLLLQLADVNKELFFDARDSRRYFKALWKARYTYRNQAPDFTATPAVSRAYRLVMEEAALYAAAAPSFSMSRAVGGLRNR